jgi:hypothetical protein
MRQQRFKNYAKNREKTSTIDESCCYATSSIVVALLFQTLHWLWIKTLLLLAALHSRTTVGELAARAKTSSPKEQLRKPLQNFKFQISPFVASGSLFGGLILLEIGDSEHSPLGFYHCRPPNLYNDHPLQPIQHFETHPGRCHLARAWRST